MYILNIYIQYTYLIMLNGKIITSLKFFLRVSLYLIEDKRHTSGYSF